MREWKVGEFCHYNVGSDTYPLVVVEERGTKLNPGFSSYRDPSL